MDHYVDAMPGDRRPARRMSTQPMNHALDAFAGQWVATLDGRVIAWAATSRELAAALRALPEQSTGATAQFVPRPARGYKVGVG